MFIKLILMNIKFDQCKSMYIKFDICISNYMHMKFLQNQKNK